MTEEKNDNICLHAAHMQMTTEPFCFQYVYETLPSKLSFPLCHAHSMLCLATEGTCTLCTNQNRLSLQKGDLFCIYAGCTFSFENIHQFKYLYISLYLQEPNGFWTSHGMGEDVSVCPGFEELIGFWMTTMGRCTEDNLPTLTKGVLYYTLALLPQNTVSHSQSGDDMISQICSMIQRCYGDSSLSLQSVCGIYNYHPNYISRQFSQKMGCSFTEYLRRCRIQHAAKLLTETELPIQEIAYGVGYDNALYFSRIFRSEMGVSPSAYRKNTVKTS